MSSALDELVQELLRAEARPADAGRTRKAEVVCYENDTLRIQGRLDKLPTVLVRDVDGMRPREVRRALVRLECAEEKGVVEFDELKALLRKEIGRLSTCSVCQTTPTDGEFATFLACGHGFHRSCIHSWAQNDHELGRLAERDEWYRPRCPNCRKPAV
jgi:hypothetical protein